MNFVYIQCAGGVGAQVLSSLVIEYFNKSKIFKDGRYFGSSGAQSIPDGISFFEKKLMTNSLNLGGMKKIDIYVGLSAE